MDKDDMIKELQRISRKIDTEVITQEHVTKFSNLAVRTIIKRFGFWEDAIKKAGLHLSVHAKRYNNEELFNNLMCAWEELARRPKYREMQEPPSRIPATAYVVKFGTWRKALQEFIKWANSERLKEVDNKQLIDNNKSTTVKTKPVQNICLSNGKRDRRRTPNPKLRFLVMKEDKYQCRICERSVSDGIKLEVDHIIPWAKGGRTIYENLRTLCSKCNKGKGKLFDEK
jgi:5-methylcytosine-specific restriction endonuclease McrA